MGDIFMWSAEEKARKMVFDKAEGERRASLRKKQTSLSKIPSRLQNSAGARDFTIQHWKSAYIV